MQLRQAAWRKHWKVDELERQAVAAKQMYPNANVVEETCRKLATTGMNAVLSPQESGSSITGSASGIEAAADHAQEAASCPLRSSAAKSSAAKSSQPSSAAMPHADDMNRLQSTPKTAACAAASSGQGGLHLDNSTPALPSKAPPRPLLLPQTGSEATQGTSDATHGRQEEGASPSHGVSKGVSPGAAHQLQSSLSSARTSEASGNVKESNQGSSSVWPVWQTCSTHMPSSNVQGCPICRPHPCKACYVQVSVLATHIHCVTAWQCHIHMSLSKASDLFSSTIVQAAGVAWLDAGRLTCKLYWCRNPACGSGGSPSRLLNFRDHRGVVSYR